jgi:hypothetical protein
MSMRNPARWGLPLILLTLAPLSSCRVAQPRTVETASMRIDVTSCRQKRGIVDCRLRFWNDRDGEVSFAASDVRLMYQNDRETALLPTKRNAPITIGPRTSVELRWRFSQVERGLPRGSYAVEIRNLMEDGLPLNETCSPPGRQSLVCIR